FWKKVEGTSGQHYLQAVKASTLAAKPWDQQRKSLHDQLEATKKKLTSAQHECDKTYEAIVKMANDYEEQIKTAADLTPEVQQLETQHKMAAQQALKEHACETAVAQLAAKLRAEWQAAHAAQHAQAAQAQPRGAQAVPGGGPTPFADAPALPPADGGPPTPAGPGASDGAAGGADISPEEDAVYDEEEKAMEVEELNADQKRLAGSKRAGEAVDQVLNLQGQNLPQPPQQLESTDAPQKSAKALCVAAAKGKGGKGDPA
ncbi:unnamed protein product, partial [Prorocentrum cordatum]